MTSTADKVAASPKRMYFEALQHLDYDTSGDEDDSRDQPNLPPSFGTLTSVHDVVSAPTVDEAPAEEPVPIQTPNVEVNATPVLVRNSTVQLPLPPPGVNGGGQYVVNETPVQTFQGKLRCGKVATPLSNGVSFIGETPPAAQLTSTIKTTAAQQIRPNTPVRTASAPLPRLPSLLRSSSSNLSTTALSKKRKRKETVLKMAPPERQYFLGLNFFYIPPDDANPVRKLRITRALEHGATWVKDWNSGEGISHVIVDSDLTYAEIMKWLKLDQLPSELVLVNEQWPMDCIKFRFLVRPGQMMYEVKGHDEALRRKAHGSLSEVGMSQESVKSVQSLKIKKKLAKPGRWEYVPPKQTPERSGGSGGTRMLPASQQSAFSESPDLEEALKLAQSEDRRPQQSEPQRVSGGRKELNSVLQAARDLAGPAPKTPNPKDDFEQAMQEARRLDYLPLDPSDDEDGAESNRSGSTKSLAFGRRQDNLNSNKKQKLNTSTFLCMTGGSLATAESGSNARTVSILQEMADYYTRVNDTWRPIAYRKAINTLKRQPVKITMAAEAVKLPNVGQRLADKIEEIVLTDRLRRLETTKTDPADETLRLFLGIYGVGIKQASQWLAIGYRTFDDLKKHVDLSENQKLGIEHYDDFATRIPRKEVEAIAAIVQGEAMKIDPQVRCIVGGSYRRGAETCGDIDFLVTKPSTRQTSDLAPFLSSLVSHLRSLGVLVAALAVGHTEDSSKWHGACVLPKEHGGKGVWWRIDFHLAPETELGAALIYFTGNDLFNRSMRLLAKKKGMRLNQRGLFRNVMGGSGGHERGITKTTGQLVEGRDERRIFEVLGVPWREPGERVC